MLRRFFQDVRNIGNFQVNGKIDRLEEYSNTKDKWTESIKIISYWWLRSLMNMGKIFFEKDRCIKCRRLYL